MSESTAIEVQQEKQSMTQALSVIDWDVAKNGAQVKNAADVWKMCQVIAQSGLYPNVNTPAQAFIKAQTGAEMGFSINAAMQNIHLIEGRCVLGAAMMLARIINSQVGDYEFIEWTDEVCTIEWSRFKRGEWKVVGRSTWTIKEARNAGLTSRKPWMNTPTDMLRSRSVGRGARSFFPDLFMGVVYDPDEADDFREVKQVGPVRGADAVAAKLGEPEVTVESTPAPTKTRAKKGEAQPASSTVTTPASPAAAQPASPQSTSTVEVSTSAVTSTTSSASTSSRSESSSTATPASSAQPVVVQTSEGTEALAGDVIDMETEAGEQQASTSGPTSETQQPQTSATSTEESAPVQSSPTNDSALASSPSASAASSDAFSAAVKGMSAFIVDGKVTATPASISAYVMKQQQLLTPEEFIAVRITAMAINNKKNGHAIDTGFDDSKKAALEMARLVPGNPLD